MTLHLSLRKLLVLCGAKIYPASAKFLAAFMRGTPQHSDNTVFKVFQVGAFLSPLAPLSALALNRRGRRVSVRLGGLRGLRGRARPLSRAGEGAEKLEPNQHRVERPRPNLQVTPRGDGGGSRSSGSDQSPRQRPEPAAALSASGRRGGELGESALPSERPARRCKTGWKKPESGNVASFLAPNDGAGWAGGAPESAGRAARCRLPFRRW